MFRKYYTIQNIGAWKDAQSKGYLEGHREHIYDKFLDAYSWMMNQMKKKLTFYNSEYPVWLWIKRPDLRCGGLLNPGERGVLLEVCIPEDRVLLSDFESWHCVLNNAPVVYTEDEWELIKQGESQISKEQSWERIFNVDYTLNKKEDRVLILQGCTGGICINEIVSIKEFVAKNIRI